MGLMSANLASAANVTIVAAGAGDSRFFQTSDGTKLHFLYRGPTDPGVVPRPVLVFVPGWSMPAAIWEPQLAHFSKTHRVVAFDPRSQGRSDLATGSHAPERRALDLAELLDHLSVRADPAGYVLAGWSLGVLECLTFLTNHGDRGLKGLILVDNSIGEDPPPVARKSDFLKHLRDPQKRPAAVEGFVRSMFKTPREEAYLRAITDAALRINALASVQLLSQPFPRTYWREAVYRVEQPVYYIVTPKFAGQAGNLKARHPTARISIFDGAGHALFVDEAARFNTLVAAFLREAVEVPSSAPRRAQP